MNQNERDEIVRLFEAQRQLQRADAVPDRLNEMGLEEAMRIENFAAANANLENMEDGEEENGRHNVPWLGHMEGEMEEEAYDSGRSSIEEMDDHLQEINRNVDFARPALKRRHDPNSDPCDAQLKRKKTEEEEEMDENIRKSDRG